MTARSPYTIALTAALGLFLVILDNTIVNVAVVPISHALHAELSTIQWVITAYFLAQASIIPVAGYFGLRFGMKRVYLLSLGLFVLSSCACALARNEWQLIAARVLQGWGGGALFPLAQAITYSVFTGPDRARAASLTALPVLLGPTFGPMAGGWLSTYLGWPSIFWVNVPIGLIGLALAVRNFSPDRRLVREAGKQFDVPGLLLCIFGMFALTYAFALVGEPRPGTADALHPHGIAYGWLSPEVLAWFGGGLVLTTWFALYALHASEEPVLDLRLFARRDYAVASMVVWMIAGIFFGSMFLLPVFFQQVRVPHLSAFQAGWMLMPQGIGSALAIWTGGQFYRRLGSRNMALLGVLSLGLSSWQISRIGMDTEPAALLPWIFLRGVGFGFAFHMMQSKAIEHLPTATLPRAASLSNATRQMSSSIGLAIVVSLFGQWTLAHVGTGEAVAGEKALAEAGLAAFQDVFILAAVLTLPILCLLGYLPDRETEEMEREERDANILKSKA